MKIRNMKLTFPTNIKNRKQENQGEKYVKKTHENGNCTILENKYLAKP